jgi:hypothetical protein
MLPRLFPAGIEASSVLLALAAKLKLDLQRR